MDYTLKKENIFWHEVGHYCAQQLNKKYYGKFGCRGIEIIKVDQNGVIRYKGGATQNTPPDHDPDSPEINHPASFIGSLVYGCIFQSCFLNEPFAACFNTRENGANGFNDYDRVWGTANFKFSLSDDEKDKLDDEISAQFKIVCTNLTKFGIFKTEISNLIERDEETTWIPAEELDKRFTLFLNQHGELYKPFVDRVVKLFDGKKQYIFKPNKK